MYTRTRYVANTKMIASQPNGIWWITMFHPGTHMIRLCLKTIRIVHIIDCHSWNRIGYARIVRLFDNRKSAPKVVLCGSVCVLVHKHIAQYTKKNKKKTFIALIAFKRTIWRWNIHIFIYAIGAEQRGHTTFTRETCSSHYCIWPGRPRREEKKNELSRELKGNGWNVNRTEIRVKSWP